MNWRKSSYSNPNGACAEVGQDWRKSSYSFSNGNCVEAGHDWRTSSYSMSNGHCVEAAGSVLVRDTQDRSGPVLSFSPDAWREFTARLRDA